MDAAKVTKLFFLRASLLCVVLGAFVCIAVTVKPALLETILVVERMTPNADALVVMAGSRSERNPVTARLYREGYASRILLTNDGILGGWSSKFQRNLYLVEWAREYLLEEGVPEDAIELLGFSESGSYYDALNTRSHVLAAGNIQSLLVVTSDYHTRRTLWVFEHVFSGMNIRIGVYPIPKDKGRRLGVLATELVKLVYYRVRYGLFSQLFSAILSPQSKSGEADGV